MHTIVSTCQIARIPRTATILRINRAMAGLYKYFQRQSLPTSKETGLNEVATKEANASVEKALKLKILMLLTQMKIHFKILTK